MILLSKDGNIAAQGSWEYVKSTPEYKEYREYESELEDKNDDQSEVPDENNDLSNRKLTPKERNLLSSCKMSDTKTEHTKSSLHGNDSPENSRQVSKCPVSHTKRKNTDIAEKLHQHQQEIDQSGKLINKEKKYEGMVSIGSYKFYMGSGNTAILIFMILFFTLTIGIKITSDWWLGQWSQHAYKNLGTDEYSYIYVGIFFIYVIVFLIKSYFFAKFSSSSSFNIFIRLVKNILIRNLAFFDTTQSGQILNLTTSDIEKIDFLLPFLMRYFLDGAFSLLGALILAGFIMPVIIILIVIFAVIFVFKAKKFLRASLEYRRINELSISPFLTKLSEFIQGQRILVSYRIMTYRMKQKIEQFINLYLNSSLSEKYVSIWMALQLDLLVLLIILASGVVINLTVTKNYSWLETLGVNGSSKTSLGLAFTYLVALTSQLGFLVNSMNEVVKGMSSVQRIRGFLENKDASIKECYEIYQKGIAPEKQELKIIETDQTKNWPQNGSISVKNLSIRYRKDTRLVVDKATFEVKAGEKVALMGRTGCGKSTIFLALTRMLERTKIHSKCPAHQSSVKIGGVEIEDIPLLKLRQNIQIIPQDPFMIEGTLRQNVDPRNEYSDE